MTLLTIDTARLLDESQVGVAAANVLARRWSDASAKPEAEREKLLLALQTERDQLRERLLSRARPLIEAHARKRKASAVFERNAVVFSTLDDITAQIISEVDALGSL